MKKIVLLIIYFNCLTVFSQKKYSKTLWDKICDCPIQFATIHNNEDYSFSNEDGLFTITTNHDYAEINILGYEKLNLKLIEIKKDTIYLKPRLFVLDEVLIFSKNTYENIIESKETDYTAKPHVERFFLRTIVKKNNEIIKIADLNGKIKKQSLFNLKKNKSSKDNFSVEIENYRMAYIEDKNYYYSILSSFGNFMFLHNDTDLLTSKNFDFAYSTLKDSSYTKMNATLKKDKLKLYGDITGYYIINNEDKNFKKTSVSFGERYDNNYTIIHENWKFRTLSENRETFYKKNNFNDKLQVSKRIVNFKTENIYYNQKGVIEIEYIYFAEPMASSTKVKNNIKHDKSFFNYKFKYNTKFWESQDKLPLSKEMQLFMNKIKQSDFNSYYTIKTNIK